MCNSVAAQEQLAGLQGSGASALCLWESQTCKIVTCHLVCGAEGVEEQFQAQSGLQRGR